MYSVTERGPLAEKLIPLRQGIKTVLRGGELIDGTGRDPMPDAAIIVDGERIISVGRSADTVPPSGDNTQVIDCRDQVILPGLIDCHVHFYGENTLDRYRRYLNLRDGVRTIVASLAAFATLEAGFTTVRDLGLPGSALDLKFAINEGLILGPRILTAGRALSETGGEADVPELPYEWVKENQPKGVFCDGPYNCRKAVRLNFREGADLIKVFASSGNMSSRYSWPPHPNFTVEEIEALVDEAHRRGKKVAAHALGDEAIRNSLLGGVDTIEHSGVISDYSLLDMMAEQEVILVPTLCVYYFLGTQGKKWDVFPGGIERARGLGRDAQEMVRQARTRGVKIALGTDIATTYGVGHNAKELELLTEAGLTPMEALMAGTSVAAEALGLEQDIGTIQEGKLADLLILNKDPLEDITCLLDKESIRRVAKSSDPLVDCRQ
jgi:imidazolonepropionase-like amidohydrolase